MTVDVVFAVATIMLECENGGEFYRRVVERNYPDAKDLEDLDIEDKVTVIKS